MNILLLVIILLALTAVLIGFLGAKMFGPHHHVTAKTEDGQYKCCLLRRTSIAVCEPNGVKSPLIL